VLGRFTCSARRIAGGALRRVGALPWDFDAAGAWRGGQTTARARMLHQRSLSARLRCRHWFRFAREARSLRA